MTRAIPIIAALVLLLAAPRPASAALITTTDQAFFAAQLTGSFTLINLDAPPLNAFVPSYFVEDLGPAAAFADLGIDFVGVNARVDGGQAFQTTMGRQRLIANGTGFYGPALDGAVVVNFLEDVNGIGAFSNRIDGGTIFAFRPSPLRERRLRWADPDVRPDRLRTIHL